MGGNIYGGCYNSGYVNGNVTINIQDSIINRATIATSGVNLTDQRNNVLNTALSVFGGGYGENSEIWGSTTVNLEKGDAFKVFGGGEKGIIGKKSDDPATYAYNQDYSTYVNLNGSVDGAAGDIKNMAVAEIIYGGGFQGPVIGDTHVNLGKGRVYRSFGGSFDAIIYGHAETYVGRGTSDDGNTGFPWITDNVYGGNDLGGKIRNAGEFISRVNSASRSSVYQYDAGTNTNPEVTKASAYVEYIQGRAVYIFGGSNGYYDYDGAYSSYTKPYFENSFVNFKPAVNSTNNRVTYVFGAGQGYPGSSVKDLMQDRSYVLVDIPQAYNSFLNSVFFGGGAFSGVGMNVSRAKADANTSGVEAASIVDLVHGKISSAYGASYEQGVTRRTIVNVPVESTVSIDNIFAGGYGDDNRYPCDTYEAILNYAAPNATVGDAENYGAIYGGNNNARRTLYSKVNVSAPLKKSNGYDGYVYGAGKGKDSWSQYTEVNILDGGSVYEAYGGGNAGKVLNTASVAAWNNSLPAADKIGLSLVNTDYTDDGLSNALAHINQLYADTGEGDPKYNTNVHIYQGGSINNYCYGGGYGADATVSGTTYIDLLGGYVKKDMYAAGTSGAVRNLYESKGSTTFTATTHAYVRGGTVRNVYGGGWEGDVGYHDASTVSTTNDIPGESNVYIGMLSGTSFEEGIPTVHRNAYAGGEGGAVFGTSNITLYNGYVGYAYNPSLSDDPATELDDRYEEKIGDDTYDDGHGYGNNTRLLEAGNIFGGGYADYSNSDFTNVYMYKGFVRNSVYGGGEIGTVGRGQADGTVNYGGYAKVYLYSGHVMHDVFGGGRGFDNLNRMSAIGTSGYVFGKTKVYIYGGEVGTADGVTRGYGNVFGGGNIGFVYSPDGTKGTDGYYYNNGILTEDCSVIVAPACQVLPGNSITLNGTTYNEGDYVPAEDLNYLKNKNYDKAKWDMLNVDGVIIRNAVFAGGNVSTGSDQVYANTVTVYGNATATLFDIYNRDLITIGTEHVGGLYGDGNLTFVDGYRELNVSNYGTDYYGMSDNISLQEYYELTDRERAYFELKYRCKAAYESEHLQRLVNQNEDLLADDYELLPDDEKGNWELAGFCSIYAGRLLNTLQRSDFVGIFGSRMVLQGAQDRVPEEVDYTNYTINRVGEVSLNRNNSLAGDATKDATHGCYFGIYNIVNYLAALTSDVDMNDVRTTDQSNAEYAADGTTTYYQYKEANAGRRKRNNGTSIHKVALASGVYLELTTEESTPTNKVWGPITGVCQLDLINVMTGLGGGYVYAKNIHGTRVETGNDQTILSEYNKAGYGHAKAVTNKKYDYNTSLQPIQTSGNFIHNVKQIIDDCYPEGGNYSGANPSEAHYWYIRGEIYVYDQYISAYTGSASAYSESINMPLTVTPASNGELVLKDVQPNLYAYYDETTAGSETLIGENGLLLGTVTYQLNDPITYWDWFLLSNEDRRHFVPETYVTSESCTLSDNTEIPSGKVMLPSEYEAYKAKGASVTNASGESVPFEEVFHLTNHISHSAGYALTFDMTNPAVWGRYYTPMTGTSVTGKLTTKDYNDPATNQGLYYGAPTYRPDTDGVYGQHYYSEDDIIPDNIHSVYEALGTHKNGLENQATVVRAYVAKDEVTYTIEGVTHKVYKGSSISATEYAQLSSAAQAKFAEASVCTSTIELGNNEFVYYGDLLTADEITEKKAAYKTYLQSSQGLSASDAQTVADATFATSVSNAWYCTEAGMYGGDWYEQARNYRALEAWSSMSDDDRRHFTFNYDAFDVLIDEDFQGNMNEYDGYSSGTTPLQELYSDKVEVDYTATYTGTGNLTYTDEGNNTVTIVPNQHLDREGYKDIPNEKRYYSAFKVESAGDYYFVKVPFTKGDVPYTVGTIITSEQYASLDAGQQANIMTKTFTSGQVGTYYFCRKPYTVGANGEGVPVTDFFSSAVTDVGSTVNVGVIITDIEYASLPNKQADFLISGTIPVATSTLYVSRQSNIKDINKDKIVSIIYEYTYEESDESGIHVEQITEKHVVNVHLQFKSGVPTITELQKPDIVLPSSTVGLKQPNVIPGAFEIIGGGWEMFTNQEDAESHTNGQPYFNNMTPVYWYQNGYYVAYYAKSYLGKTYSNAVQLSVANYHDLDAVMKDKEHHMYIYETDVDRDPKIYIDNRTCESDPDKSELDLLKDFFELTLHNELNEDGYPVEITGTGGVLDGHYTVKDQIKRGDNLQFILKSDVSPKAYTNWTPIGNDTDGCFMGVFHGDGYTISGLNHSLFGKLCGDVYNLGVTGSFTSAGIADKGEGFVQNSWIYSSATDMDDNIQAIVGEPLRGNTGDNLVQIVNCYYPETNVFTITENQHNGAAISKPVNAFYNGEVAYDLNGFYLFKRYSDHTSLANPSYTYKYLDANDLDDLGNMRDKDGGYAAQPDFAVGYVEARYSDGDFRYQDGYIPDNTNDRYISNSAEWHPIWPDDYLYFGQLLTYGHVDARAHQDLPTHVNKSGYRLLSSGSNRVYRAPAYFQSKEMSVVHFNPDAVFAAESEDGTHQAYPDMTAIDFTGYNDVSHGYQLRRVKTAPYNSFADGAFYPPLLDDDGLTSFFNVDLTRNLLVYIPDGSATGANTADVKTYTVVTDYLTEPVYTETNAGYRTVNTNTATLYGHPVVLRSGSYSAEVDHFLVDKNDFNAPIEYTFSTGKRMWYQRVPDTYVDLTNKGWEGISLPFTAELVTTQTKGEITHFYSGSRIADESTADGTRVGHEYWLREFTSGGAADAVNTDVFKANFKYPDAGSNSKTVSNTFLYDYYYSKSDRKDDNADQYHTYYNNDRTYTGYEYAQAATPYIIGFPGSNYYEFDLSGKFVPANTEATFTSALPKQTITFASNTAVTINVSDDELAAAAAAPVADGYRFNANYMSKPIATGSYVLNAEGSSYTETTADQPAVPFRPYFSAVPSSPAPERYSALVISPVTKSQLEFEGEYDPDNGDQTDMLNIFARRGKIVVESLCRSKVSVRIVNSTGMLIDIFDIQPGEVIETPISSSGIYFVNTKKLRVTGR